MAGDNLLTLSRGTYVEPMVRVDEIGALARVREPGVELALWARQLDASLAKALDDLDLGAIDDLALTVDLPISASAFAASLVVSGHATPVARLLAGDILDLANHYAVICGVARVAIRLEGVETDACCRYHADYVTLRLITTYVGGGTQWIRADCPERVETMARGEVGIFKGRRLLDDPQVLHRSPPIMDPGRPRLLLVIDPAPAD